MVRSDHADRVYTATSFVEWVMRPGWSSECNKIIDALSLILSQTSDLSLAQAKKLVTEVMLERFRMFNLKGFHSNKNTSLLSRLKGFLPIGVKNVYRKLKNLTVDDSDMRLLRSKRSRFYEDFLHVERSLDLDH